MTTKAEAGAVLLLKGHRAPRTEESEFVAALSKLLGQRVKVPRLSDSVHGVDLKLLFQEVARKGGSAAVTRGSLWQDVAQTVCGEKVTPSQCYSA